MGNSEARFTINVKEGIVELEGKESFVDKHLEKFEEIFKAAVREAIANNINAVALRPQPAAAAMAALPSSSQQQQQQHVQEMPSAAAMAPAHEQMAAPAPLHPAKQTKPSTPRPSPTLPPIPVDLKPNESKPGLREFYAEKKPANHYEKTAVFVYYITKFNRAQEVKYGEVLSCYEEVDEKKPSVTDIVKNSIRYKGWLEQGSDKFTCRLTISGENYVKFDLPTKKAEQQQQQTAPLVTTS
ncbi:MAG: hypothetical protein C4292_01280 [Nitrososphaera sp.]